MIKEDVGLYVAAFGLYVALVDRMRTWGFLTVAVGLAWTAFALRVAMPAFGAGGGGYSFLSRWSGWGDGIGGGGPGFLYPPHHPLRGPRAGGGFKIFSAPFFSPLFSGGRGVPFLLPSVVPPPPGFF